MKKWYSIGLLVLLLVLVGTLLAACDKEETTTTAAPTTEVTEATETTAAPEETETTEAAGGTEATTADSLGFHFVDAGNNVVTVTDVPAPGMTFPITTEGDFACTIEVFDASGASLGNLETTDGNVDYSEFADTAAKIVFTAATGEVYEYQIP